jgi:hypothetical protein
MKQCIVHHSAFIVSLLLLPQHQIDHPAAAFKENDE